MLKIWKVLFCVCGMCIAGNFANAKICYLPLSEGCDGNGKINNPNTPDSDSSEPEEKLCTGYNLDYALGEKYKCESCEDSKGMHYRCVLIEHEPDADCQKFLGMFKSVKYAPISAEECQTLKDELGLEKCVSEGDDYYAGAVKACGGVDNLITGFEATKLAHCMYLKSVGGSSVYGQRINLYLESFKADTGDHVFVWTKYEGKNPDEKGAIVRMYDFYGSIPYYAERNGSFYYVQNGKVATEGDNDSILSETLCRVK